MMNVGTKEKARIMRVKVRNIKAIKLVDFVTGGDQVVTVGGPNEAGKSSFLDSIVYTLMGKGKLPQMPLRKGAKSGESMVETEKLVIKRIFTEKDSRLVITAKDGTQLKSPQAILNELVGPVGFDPLKFVEASDKEQVETLQKLLKLDFNQLDMDRSKTYDSRTTVNREVARLKVEIDGLPITGPVEPVSVVVLTAKLQAANEANAEIKSERDRLDNLGRDKAEKEKKVEALEEQLAMERDILAALEKELAAQHEVVSSMTEVDVSDIVAQIGAAEATNKRHEQHLVRQRREAAMVKLEEEAAALTEKLKLIDEQKIEMIRAANFPLEGLGMDEATVTMNGIPIKQCSKAQQYAIGVSIGFALSPNMPIMIIQDASLLDSKHRAQILKVAEQYGGQVWEEVVAEVDDESGRVAAQQKCSLVIVDGMASYQKGAAPAVEEDDMDSLAVKDGE